VWSLDGQDTNGRLSMAPEWGDTPAHWAIYLAVDSAEAACERATAAGGTVVRPPFDSPYGRIAGVCDPAGATFNVVSLSERTEDPAP
jgi:predicted enzyme related to lactoylglutathione lyase